MKNIIYEIIEVEGIKFKTCNKCEKLLPLTEYHKGKNRRNGIHSNCRTCCNIQTHKWHLKISPEQRHDIHLKRNYGISLVQYKSLLRKQANRCAICKQIVRNNKLCVDHNHKTKAVRGLLCNKCNQALGLLQEKILNCKNMISYLKKYNR